MATIDSPSYDDYEGEALREVPRLEPEASTPPTKDTLKSIPIAAAQGALDEAVREPGRDEQHRGAQKARREPAWLGSLPAARRRRARTGLRATAAPQSRTQPKKHPVPAKASGTASEATSMAAIAIRITNLAGITSSAGTALVSHT